MVSKFTPADTSVCNLFELFKYTSKHWVDPEDYAKWCQFCLFKLHGLPDKSFLTRAPSCFMPHDSHGHPAKQWCCWLLPGTARGSPHLPPQFARLAEEREAMASAVLLRGLIRFPGPTQQMLAGGLRNDPQQKPQIIPLPALFSTAYAVPLPFCSSFISTHYCLCLGDAHYFSHSVIDGLSTILYGPL